MTTSKWAQVRKINTELEVSFFLSSLLFSYYDFSNFHIQHLSQPFLKITLSMEGDGPTGCMVIPKYVEIRNALEKKIQPLDTTHAMYPMLSKMLEKTIEYLNEAVACETLVMATVLHPFFRLKFFTKWFGPDSSVTMSAESTLRRLHREYQLAAPIPKSTSSQIESKNSKTPATSSPKLDTFNSDSEDEPEIEVSEDLALKNYLKGSYKMKTENYNVQDPISSLEWWKVSVFLSFRNTFLRNVWLTSISFI